MLELKDQTGNWVRLENYPRRIVCLVPSITELLADLGLENEVVGITRFCVHPAAWFRTKEKVGGTKKVSLQKVQALTPDLIIANKEENVKEQVALLATYCPVYTSDISNLGQTLEMIGHVGKLTGKIGAARSLVAGIGLAFSKLQPLKPSLKTAYLIWKNPFLTIGGDTYIHDLMTRCGLENISATRLRYPEITLDEIAGSGCQLILLSSEPYPFKEKHRVELELQLAAAGIKNAPAIQIELVNGEMFSWYGSRPRDAADYFKLLQSRILRC